MLESGYLYTIQLGLSNINTHTGFHVIKHVYATSEPQE